jgi:hypothetical protein
MKKKCKECIKERKEYGVRYCPSCYYSGGKEIDEKIIAKIDKKKKKGFSFRKFFKLLTIRLANKMIEIGVLFAIGYSLGLKLVRY